MDYMYPHHVQLGYRTPRSVRHSNIWLTAAQVICLLCLAIVSIGSIHLVSAAPIQHANVSVPVSSPVMSGGFLQPLPKLSKLDLVPQPQGGVPPLPGQVILVSDTQQWLWVYQDHVLINATPVTTGRPEIPTPVGIYHVEQKSQNLTFTSAFAPGSPLYYTPEHVNYALYFRATGFYIHDAPWRQDFGPGSNLPHQLPNGTTETGSHGCVNVTTTFGSWLFQWAKLGTTIDIIA